MLSGWCAKMEWQRGGRLSVCSWLMQPSGKSLLVSGSFSRCQGQPHPFIPLSCEPDQLPATLYGRKWILLNQSLEVGQRVDQAGIPPLLPLCQGKEKRKHNTGKRTFSLCPPPPLHSPLISLYFTLSVGNRVVCSVAPHWLNMSMNKWTQAFPLAQRPALNVRSCCVTFWSHVSCNTYSVSHYVILSLSCKHSTQHKGSVS